MSWRLRSGGGFGGPSNERGTALPAWTLLVSVAVVATAVLALLVTGSPDRSETAEALSGRSSLGPTATTTLRAPPKPAATVSAERGRQQAKPGHPVPQAYVEVYNNSSVPGLADRAAAKLRDAGWEVVGTDSWTGAIPETTVYYPHRLHRQARLLADDLGVRRLHPAVDPMRFDRLTLILTGRL